MSRTIRNCTVISCLLMAMAVIMGLCAVQLGSHTACAAAIVTAIVAVSVYVSSFWWNALQK